MNTYFAALPSELLSLLILENFTSRELLTELTNLSNIKIFERLLSSRRFLLSLYRRDISSFLTLSDDFTNGQYIKLLNTISKADYYHDNPNDLSDTEKTVLYLSEKGYDILLFSLLDSENELVFCHNAILQALAYKHIIMIPKILEIQAKILSKSPNNVKLHREAQYYNNIALSKAATYGDIDLVTLLMYHGADVYELAYMEAVSANHITIVEKMIEKIKTNKNNTLANIYGMGAQRSGRLGHLEILKFLLKKGASNYGEIARFAVIGNQISVINLMLDRGLTNINECMDIAKYLERNEIIKLLEAYMSKN